MCSEIETPDDKKWDRIFNRVDLEANYADGIEEGLRRASRHMSTVRQAGYLEGRAYELRRMSYVFASIAVFLAFWAIMSEVLT